MNRRLTTPAVIALLLLGCATQEGTYSPGCMAYAGSSIRLDNEQFFWEKFTDSVVVDESGDVVNQFPGYPMSGRYRVDGQKVYLDTTAGEPIASMYLQQHDERDYLLTAEQFQALGETGKYDDCALVLGGYIDSK